MARKYTFHRENCNCCIREIVVDTLGRTIVLSGQHAFEWSITVYDIVIRRTIYKNREEALKDFKRYKRKR